MGSPVKGEEVINSGVRMTTWAEDKKANAAYLRKAKLRQRLAREAYDATHKRKLNHGMDLSCGCGWQGAQDLLKPALGGAGFQVRITNWRCPRCNRKLLGE